MHKCKRGMEKLDELDTPWAKPQLKTLQTACEGHTGAAVPKTEKD